MITKNIKEKIISSSPYMCFLLLAILLYARCFYGFDWSDEAFYAAVPYRFFLGDPVFLSSWDTNQTSSIILVPLVALYVLVKGNTVGILLFMRIVYTTVKVAIAIFSFRVLKKYIPQWAAIVASSFFLLSYYCIHAFSYNSIPMPCLTAAILFLLTETKGAAKQARYFLSGLFTAIAVLAYPTMIAVIPCFLVYLLCDWKFNKNTGFRDAVWYTIGGFTVLFVFLVFVHMNSSISNFIENFHFVFQDPEHTSIFSVQKYLDGFYSMIGDFPGVLVLTVITVFAFGYSLLRKKKESRKSLDIILSVISFGMAIYILYINSNDHYTNQMALIGVIFFPMLFFLSGWRFHFSFLFYFVGLSAAFSLGIMTNNSNAAEMSAYYYLLCLVATIIYIFQCIPMTVSIRRATVFPLVMLAAVLFYFNTTEVYRDNPLSSLNTMLLDGPAAGLITTADKAQKYGVIINSIDSTIPEDGYILYIRLLPFGYLHGSMRPAAPRLWRTNLNYDGFQEYYSILPERKPSVIYIVKNDYGLYQGAELVWSEYMLELVENGNYQIYETECAVIYLRL